MENPQTIVLSSKKESNGLHNNKNRRKTDLLFRAGPPSDGAFFRKKAGDKTPDTAGAVSGKPVFLSV
jgi:hypothetical protein